MADELTNKLLVLAEDAGSTLVSEIKQRHADPANGENGKPQMTTGKTIGLLHIERTATGFKLIGWTYSGTYEEGRAPSKNAWGSGGSGSTDWSDSLIRWAEAKGITFKDERQAQGWAYCVMRKIATQGSKRYRDPSARRDIFTTPINNMTETLRKQILFYTAEEVKRTLLRIDLKN